MELRELRKKIDEIDNELLELIGERVWLVPQVAAYKKKNNLKVFQPEREDEIIKDKRKIAEEKGINPDLIEKIFKLMIEDSKRIQKEQK